MTTPALAAAIEALRSCADLLEQAMREAETARGAEQELPLLLHAEEAAELLRIDKATVYRMARTGQLPSLRLGEGGSAVRISRDGLLRWIQQQADATTRPAGTPLTIMRGSRPATKGGARAR